MSKVSQAPTYMGATSNEHARWHDTDRQVRQFQRMKVVGNLMCGLAHDFNNILTIVLSCTELAQVSERSRSQIHLQGVTDAATRGQRLVQQVLRFGRQREQAPKIVNLAEVIQETVSLLHASLPASIKIVSTRAVHPSLVLADPIQLSQVLVNLCLNGAQSMDSADGVLELSLLDVPMNRETMKGYSDIPPGSFVRLRVRDTGSGIPPEVIEHIFDPFFTTKQSGEGMGMGLTVVRDIVTTHHGIMSVDSKVGQGTLFDIYLPRISDRVEVGTAMNWPIKEEDVCPTVDEEFSICQDFQERRQQIDSTALAQTRN